jgi:hypothetical protein
MLAAPARAEPPIAWDAPAGCAELPQVMAVAEELTGARSSLLSPRHRVRGVVEPSGRGWQLSLSLIDGTRERVRRITAPSCSELARSAGVALALALEPGVAGEGQSEAASSPNVSLRETDRGPGPHEPERHEAGLDATAHETLPATSAAPGPRLAWRLEAAALLDGVALGAAAPGLGVSFGARHAALSGFVYGTWLPARREEVDGGGSVALALLTGGVRACHELASGLLTLDGCGGVELGRLIASGEGLADAASYADWWLAPSLGLSFESRLAQKLYFRAGADLLVPVLREAYRVNDDELVFRPPSLGFRAAVALGLELGGDD